MAYSCFPADTSEGLAVKQSHHLYTHIYRNHAFALADLYIHVQSSLPLNTYLSEVKDLKYSPNSPVFNRVCCNYLDTSRANYDFLFIVNVCDLIMCSFYAGYS